MASAGVPAPSLGAQPEMIHAILEKSREATVPIHSAQASLLTPLEE